MDAIDIMCSSTMDAIDIMCSSRNMAVGTSKVILVNAMLCLSMEF
jgi:hypothetical protein